MKTPRRILFLSILVCICLVIVTSYSYAALMSITSRYLYSTISIPSNQLLLARYYLYSGRANEAAQEYQRVITTALPTESKLASAELKGMLGLQKTFIGEWISVLLNLTWSVLPKLYLFTTILIPIWLLVLLIELFRKKQIFAILPFVDNSGIGVQLQEIVYYRMREISWSISSLQSANSLISDNLEIPAIGMIDEKNTIDTIALLETALSYSLPINNVPLSKFLNSVKLWFEQPKYLVKGYLEKKDFIKLHILLIDRKSGDIIRVWDNKIDDENLLSKVSDAVIYPLLFHFSSNLQTNNWEALHALHEGLENFQLMQEHKDTTDYLQQTRNSMERALLFDPRYLVARYNLGFIALAIGDYDKAREQFREVALMGQDEQLRMRATYNYGVALYHLSQDWAYRRAAETFEKLLNDEGVSKNSFSTHIQSSLAITYAKMASRTKNGQVILANRAIKVAENILANQNASAEAKANSFAGIGYAYLVLANTDLAISSFQKGVELAPNSIMPLLGLGEAYTKINRNEDAIATLQRAKLVSPASGYASYRMGNLYRELGEVERAIEALQCAPELSIARVALGKIYQNDGLYEEALVEFRKAVEINRRQIESWVNIAWTILLLGNSALYPEAEFAARRALQLEHNEDQLWHRHAVLAKCLIENNKNELALNEANKAVALGSEKSQAYYYLAIAQYRLQQYSRARENLQKAMTLDNKKEWQAEIKELMVEIESCISGTV